MSKHNHPEIVPFRTGSLRFSHLDYNSSGPWLNASAVVYLSGKQVLCRYNPPTQVLAPTRAALRAELAAYIRKMRRAGYKVTRLHDEYTFTPKAKQ